MIYLIIAILAALMGCASFMILTHAGENDGICKYRKDDK